MLNKKNKRTLITINLKQLKLTCVLLEICREYLHDKICMNIKLEVWSPQASTMIIASLRFYLGVRTYSVSHFYI
jgi:hypothetical protein